MVLNFRNLQLFFFMVALGTFNDRGGVTPLSHSRGRLDISVYFVRLNFANFTNLYFFGGLEAKISCY